MRTISGCWKEIFFLFFMIFSSFLKTLWTRFWIWGQNDVEPVMNLLSTWLLILKQFLNMRWTRFWTYYENDFWFLKMTYDFWIWLMIFEYDLCCCFQNNNIFMMSFSKRENSSSNMLMCSLRSWSTKIWIVAIQLFSFGTLSRAWRVSNSWAQIITDHCQNTVSRTLILCSGVGYGAQSDIYILLEYIHETHI